MRGYERVGIAEKYYVDTEDGCVYDMVEQYDRTDKCIYDAANYYSDKTVAQNNARADRLMRQLRRYAAEHNEGEIDWNNLEQEKYSIIYTIGSEQIRAYSSKLFREFGQIYFTSREIAEQAMEEFKNELLWYFTEYQDHIVNADKKVECDYCGNAEKLKEMATLEFEFCPKCGNKLGGAE